jgi:FkbM family methyltransferase
MRLFSQNVIAGEYAFGTGEKPRTVLDLGANIGAFAAWAKHTWPDCEVWCYEPVPRNYEFFRENLNGTPGVYLATVGVRDKAGKGPVYTGLENCGQCSFIINGEQRNEVECESEYIDAATLPSCEFVKVDVEGCETEIVERLDLRETKWIAVETHGNAAYEKIDRTLIAKGFLRHEATHTFGNNLVAKYTRKVQKKLFVAVPIYQDVPGEFAVSMNMLTRARYDFPVMTQFLQGDSLVTRVRNNLTAMFLESDASDLLFLDCDLVFKPEHIASIMRHDEAIVAGFYARKKSDSLMWVANRFPDQTEMTPDARGLVHVRYAGTGFMRISRAVFENMIHEWGEQLWYKPDSGTREKEYEFWKVGIYRGDGFPRYLSEDWYFCQLANDLGYKVWLDCKVFARHIGRISYPLKQFFPNDI